MKFCDASLHITTFKCISVHLSALLHIVVHLNTILPSVRPHQHYYCWNWKLPRSRIIFICRPAACRGRIHISYQRKCLIDGKKLAFRIPYMVLLACFAPFTILESTGYISSRKRDSLLLSALQLARAENAKSETSLFVSFLQIILIFNIATTLARD